MEELLGKYGPFLFDLAHGRDDREVDGDGEPRTRGAETTFEHDVLAVPVLQQTIGDLADEVAESLHGMSRLARTVTLKLRYQDFTHDHAESNRAQAIRRRPAHRQHGA